MASPQRLPIVLGVSGASAQPLALRALQLLLEAGETVDLVVSRGAINVWLAELGIKVPVDPQSQQLFWREQTATEAGTLRCHRWSDQAAAIASGSHRTAGMVILPCSMGRWAAWPVGWPPTCWSGRRMCTSRRGVRL